jgi:hypothetical protein
MYPRCPVWTPEGDDVLAAVDFIEGAAVLEKAHMKYSIAKLKLKPLEFITDMDVYGLCHAYDNIPFAGTMPQEWRISRQTDLIRVEHKRKLHNYSVDTYNGNVTLYREGKTSNLGRQVYVTQWLCQNYYAFPLYQIVGDPHHKGKTPFELGLAIPDRAAIIDRLNVIYGKDESNISSWFGDKQLFGVNLHDINVYRQTVTELQREVNELKKVTVQR